MDPRRIIVVGGGAAGFFAAITCAEAAPDAEVCILERGPRFLSKVRISGGGRCNVTHACFDPRDFAARFPRGERALISPFTSFQAADTVAWFQARGVALKTEADGRMFPGSDSSQTIVDCLLGAARAAGVTLRAHTAVRTVAREPGGAFDVSLGNGEELQCDRLLAATGGCRTPAAAAWLVALGHTLEPPVPSLFTFHLETPWPRELAGVSVATVEASVPGTGLRERGAILMTHQGLSGPVILRLSAWGARLLHGCGYRFTLRVNWVPDRNDETLREILRRKRQDHPARRVLNTPLDGLPARLWERLLGVAGVEPETRWAVLSRRQEHRLVQVLSQTELQVLGQSLNKEEFVTCGGIRLCEVDFKTMESRVCPGLYLAGEVLDLDGITGGFNFQAAWTTGWIAGTAMAGTLGC